MSSVRIPLEAGGYYHIFNHAIGSENVFREDENYFFFLRKVSSRITAFADVLAYCLMPNHFHLLIKIKDKKELVKLWENKLMRRKEKSKLAVLTINELLDNIMTTEFGTLFNSYVQAYNKKYFRQGALLKESFQRKRIDNGDYLLKVVCYIHNNPVEHHFTEKPGDWKYSSYNAILSDGKTNILREEVIELFGGRDNFAFMHRLNVGVEI